MYTYLFVTEYLNRDVINELFKKRGNWIEKSDENEKLDCLYTDGKSSYRRRDLWTIEKYIFNMIDYDKLSIINKNVLYKILNKEYPKIAKEYMMEQFYIDKVNPDKYKKLFRNGQVWILKPVEGFRGKGITVTSNYNTFVNNIRKDDSYVLAEYINDPLLFKNKKFHIRIYYLYDPVNKKGYLHRYGRIYTAKKEYIQKYYNNSNIHDSHFGKTDADYFFPHELIKLYPQKIIINIYKQLIQLFHYITLITDAKCYPESQYCYQIFGADIMITKDFKVKLLEINEKIGIASYDNKLITEYLVGGILETIVDKILPPKNPQPKNNYFIPLN